MVKHPLNPPIKARYVRLVPTEWNNHISLRMELYGCLGKDLYNKIELMTCLKLGRNLLSNYVGNAFLMVKFYVWEKCSCTKQFWAMLETWSAHPRGSRSVFSVLPRLQKSPLLTEVHAQLTTGYIWCLNVNPVMYVWVRKKHLQWWTKVPWTLMAVEQQIISTLQLTFEKALLSL